MRTLVGVVVVAAWLCVASVAAGTPQPRVAFTVLPAGWSAADAFALSWRYQPSPTGWARSMPRDGIAITVMFPEGIHAGYPPLKLRLPRKPAATLEGTSNTPEYRIKGSVNGRVVLILVDIRNPSPTAAQRRQAQRVVSGIRFARR